MEVKEAAEERNRGGRDDERDGGWRGRPGRKETKEGPKKREWRLQNRPESDWDVKSLMCVGSTIKTKTLEAISVSLNANRQNLQCCIKNPRKRTLQCSSEVSGLKSRSSILPVSFALVVTQAGSFKLPLMTTEEETLK